MTQSVACNKEQISLQQISFRSESHHESLSQTSDFSSNLSFEQFSTILTHSFSFFFVSSESLVITSNHELEIQLLNETNSILAMHMLSICQIIKTICKRNLSHRIAYAEHND